MPCSHASAYTTNHEMTEIDEVTKEEMEEATLNWEIDNAPGLDVIPLTENGMQSSVLNNA